MARRSRTSVFLDPELAAGLKVLKARDGVPEAEAIRRGIAEYLEKRGIVLESKAARRRVAPRKRA